MSVPQGPQSPRGNGGNPFSPRGNGNNPDQSNRRNQNAGPGGPKGVMRSPWLWGIIIVISRAVSGVEHRAAPAMANAPAAVPAAAVPAAPAAPAAVPQVVLEGIDETQAACVMAIVSHETGIPLDQLVFKSIKAV